MSQNDKRTGSFSRVAGETFHKIETLGSQTETSFERVAAPVRQHIFKRFPVISLLAVTFGVIATSVGMEQLILRYTLFANHPLFLFLVGVATLVLTGTLYKKLD